MKLEQHWYRLAAEAGFAPAQFELAVQLFDSDRKSAEGVFWLRAAAVQGDEDAYDNLEVYSKLCMSCHAHVTNSQRCGARKSAFYCGGECQKAHWQAHKQECKKVRILEKKNKRESAASAVDGVSLPRQCSSEDGRSDTAHVAVNGPGWSVGA